MRRTMVICVGFMVAALGLSACGNTFHGAGRDIENMGEWMQDRF